MNLLTSKGSNNLLVDDLVRQYNLMPRIESALRAVDRALYIEVDEDELHNPYGDQPWRRGNLHLSAPCIYSRVLTELELKNGLSFLNLGSGTGYLNTVVGLLLGPNGLNHGIEIHRDVVDYAWERLDRFKTTTYAIDKYDFCEPHFFLGNCLNLNPDIRYDRVYLGAAVAADHAEFMKKLIKPNGGILIMPEAERLMKYKRVSETVWETTVFMNVNFTLMIGHGNHDPLGIEKPKTIDLPLKEVKTLKEWCRIAIRQILRAKTDHENPHLLHSDNLSSRIIRIGATNVGDSREARVNRELLVKSSRQIAREMRMNRAATGGNLARGSGDTLARRWAARGAGGSGGSPCSGPEAACRCHAFFENLMARFDATSGTNQPAASSSSAGSSAAAARPQQAATPQTEQSARPTGRTYLTRQASRLIESQDSSNISATDGPATSTCSSSANEPPTGSSSTITRPQPPANEPSSSTSSSRATQARQSRSRTSASRHLVFARDEPGEAGSLGSGGISYNLRTGMRRSQASGGPASAHSFLFGNTRRCVGMLGSLSSSDDSSSESPSFEEHGSIESRLAQLRGQLSSFSSNLPRRGIGYRGPPEQQESVSSDSDSDDMSSLSSEAEDNFDFYDEDLDRFYRGELDEEDDDSDGSSSSGDSTTGNDGDDFSSGSESDSQFVRIRVPQPQTAGATRTSRPTQAAPPQQDQEPVASRLRSRQPATETPTQQPEASSSSGRNPECPVHGKQRKVSHQCSRKHHHRHARCFNHHHSRHQRQSTSNHSTRETSAPTRGTVATLASPEAGSSSLSTSGSSSSSSLGSSSATAAVPSESSKPQARPVDSSKSQQQPPEAQPSASQATTRSSARLQGSDSGAAAAAASSALSRPQATRTGLRSFLDRTWMALSAQDRALGQPETGGKRKRQSTSSSSESSLSSASSAANSHESSPRRRHASARICRPSRCTCAPRTPTASSSAIRSAANTSQPQAPSGQRQVTVAESSGLSNSPTPSFRVWGRSGNLEQVPAVVHYLRAARRSRGSQTLEQRPSFANFLERCIDSGVRSSLHDLQHRDCRHQRHHHHHHHHHHHYHSSAANPNSRLFIGRRLSVDPPGEIDLSGYAGSAGMALLERTRRQRMLREFRRAKRPKRRRDNECRNYYLHISSYIRQLPVPRILHEYLNFDR